jgi:hypothetical protein
MAKPNHKSTRLTLSGHFATVAKGSEAPAAKRNDVAAAANAFTSWSTALSSTKAALNAWLPMSRHTPATQGDNSEIVAGNCAVSSSAPFSLMM